MSTRSITGNLAADVEVIKAGSINNTKLRVIENTGEYRGGKYVGHPDATTHFVEAKFELGENAAATLHKGDTVIVIGPEHTAAGARTGPKRMAASSTPTPSAWTLAAPSPPSGKSPVTMTDGSGPLRAQRENVRLTPDTPELVEAFATRGLA